MPPVSAGSSDQDVMAAARQQGYERLEQVKYAVADRNGGISIVCKNGTP